MHSNDYCSISRIRELWRPVRNLQDFFWIKVHTTCTPASGNSAHWEQTIFSLQTSINSFSLSWRASKYILCFKRWIFMIILHYHKTCINSNFQIDQTSNQILTKNYGPDHLHYHHSIHWFSSNSHWSKQEQK